MRPDPCEGCGSRVRLALHVEWRDYVLDRESTAEAQACWQCGYVFEIGEAVDGNGSVYTPTLDEASDAEDAVDRRLRKYFDRVVWLRRCRDYACLRWSSTSDLRWLRLARKLESARRRAAEPLRLVADPDRVDLGPAHVELLGITRTEVTTRGSGLARRWVVARRGFRWPGGPSVYVESRGALAVDLSDALLEAARMDGVFSTTGGAPIDRGAADAGGDGEGSVVAPGEAGEDGAA